MKQLVLKKLSLPNNLIFSSFFLDLLFYELKPALALHLLRLSGAGSPWVQRIQAISLWPPAGRRAGGEAAVHGA